MASREAVERLALKIAASRGEQISGEHLFEAKQLYDSVEKYLKEHE